MANPLLGILAFALVTSATAGAVLSMSGHPNPANAPRGEACGHEMNETHEANETGDHEGPGDHGNSSEGHQTWTHNESGEHDATSGHHDNAECDRESGEMEDHPEARDHEGNETEDEVLA